ncbi:MAG: hypothetical protein KDI23_09520 [Pseudomonadales bacterium]|nr:hypothetical protein [Pseudomonadales bacterium]
MTVRQRAGEQGAMVRSDGTYETEPLRADTVALGVVQTRVIGIDGDAPQPGLRANLDYMLGCIDKAQQFGGRCDLVCFHEFPLQGYRLGWTRRQSLNVAIEVPGPEVLEIAARAKRWNCYVTFGCLARDGSWPNHVFNWQVMVGPTGEVVDVHWKQRNVRGMFPGAENFTTTIYDVLDEYVEKYGRDEVVPVTRTPVGNLCTTSTQLEPEIIRAFALKGGEIMLRTATGGFDDYDIRANARYNNMYTAIVNQSISRDNPGSFEDVRSGGSAIYGPNGELLGQANSVNEGPVLARIPIRAFREKRRIPNVHAALYRDLYAEYVEAYAPNLFSAYLPSDGIDSARYLSDKRRWK